MKTAYDDGGISGGTMERPGLKQLLQDIAAKKIDIVVVYKVDRLTRSLADFVKMVELFDAHSIAFVSVTQQFNTTTSMGRLTLNVLLSFAQFEREVTGERIRDKIAASKKKGMWMGGTTPMGYEVKERKLIISPQDAEIVRGIYQGYLDLGCVRLLQKDLIRRGIRSLKGHIISRGSLYKLLSNPVYIGQIRHKDICHPGQHEALIDQTLWDQVQQHMAYNRKGSKTQSRRTERSLLTGKLFDVSGERLVPVHTKKQDRRYRYYISESLRNAPRDDAMSGWRLPARELEQTIEKATLTLLRNREVAAAAMHEAEVPAHQISEVLKALDTIDREVIIEDFIKRIELSSEGIQLTLSLASLLPDTPISMTHTLPTRMKRRGVEARLIIGDTGPARIDPTMVRAIARARGWAEELLSRKVPNLATIASREGIDQGDLSRRMMLAFLAPDIVDAIIAGRQPADLTTQKLLRRTDLPLDWAEQKRVLGFM